MIALVVLDRTEEALVAARHAYPRLSHEGDHHRLLLPLALINALRGRPETAARVAAFEAAHRAHTGENESIVASRFRDRLEPLLSKGLSVDERRRLAVEGTTLSDEEAFRLALGDAA